MFSAVTKQLSRYYLEFSSLPTSPQCPPGVGVEEQQHRDQLDAACPHLEDAHQLGQRVQLGERAHRPHRPQAGPDVADEGRRGGEGHHQVALGENDHHRAQHEDEEVEDHERRDRTQHVLAHRLAAQPAMVVC